MTLQCFLTFVGGAGVPHLSKGKKKEKEALRLQMKITLFVFGSIFVSKRFQAFVEVTLIVLSEDPEKSRSPVE